MSPEIEYERQVAAPPEAVFDAFTSPEGQREFYGQDDRGWVVESDCDLRVGGLWRIRFGPSQDEIYEHRNVFTAIERPHRVEFTTTEIRLDGSTVEYSTIFTFESRDGGTVMRVAQKGFPTEELRREHTVGVPNAFDRLVRHLAASEND